MKVDIVPRHRVRKAPSLPTEQLEALLAHAKDASRKSFAALTTLSELIQAPALKSAKDQQFEILRLLSGGKKVV